VFKKIFLGLILLLSLISVIESSSGDGLPDLIVNDITWIPEDPGVGEDFKIQVRIENIGDVAVQKSFRAKLQFDRNDRFIFWEFEDIDPIPPGESVAGTAIIDREYRQYGWSLSEGDHELHAEVDYTRRVKESNEKNNELTKTIHIGPKATTYLSLTSDATTKVKGTTTMAIVKKVEYPRYVEPGEQFEVSVTIDYSSPYEVQVWLYDVELEREMDYIEESFGPYKGSKTYTFQVTAPSDVKIWKIQAGVWYLLPSSIDPSRKFQHSEEDWYHDLQINVGMEETTKTTSPTQSSETTSQSQTGITETSTPQYVSTDDRTILSTSEKSVESEPFSISSYGTFIPIIAIIIIIAITIILWKKRQSSAPATVRYCLNCGYKLSIDDEYCDDCGTKQS
jgi:hypothetical protein